MAACGTAPPATPAEPKQTGALFGAYVSPSQATDTGRIADLETYERALGRRLDVIQRYHKWESPFPSAFDRYVSKRGDILLLSWAATTPTEISSGRYDSMIRTRAKALRALGTPILLRWRWEMNRPNIQAEIGSPEAYVTAWKHVRAIFEKVGTDNVDWVWCPLANGFEETNGKAYYPGNDQVEWLCADAYTPYPDEPLKGVLAPFMTWAGKQAPDLPIIIGEFGTRQGEPGARARWLDDAMSYFRDHEQIKGVVYYESANAPAGRYDLSQEPSAMASMRKWGQTAWLNPDWSPAR